MALQIEKKSWLGQAVPTVTIQLRDAAGRPFKSTREVYVPISYERDLTARRFWITPDKPSVFPLETNLGRAIIRIWPQDPELLKNAYIVPHPHVVDPSEGSQTISSTIFKYRGEVEPIEPLGYAWPAQLAVGLGIGVLTFAAAYGIYYHFVRGR